MVNTNNAKKLVNGTATQNGKDNKANSNGLTSGTATKPEEKKEEQGTQEQKQESKPAIVVELPTIVPPVSPSLPSLQQRLKKLAEFQNLVERRETLIEAQDNVNSFDCKSPSAAPVIQFRNSKGVGFQISHAAVIADVVALLEEKLKVQIQDVESKIAFTF